MRQSHNQPSFETSFHSKGLGESVGGDGDCSDGLISEPTAKVSIFGACAIVATCFLERATGPVFTVFR